MSKLINVAHELPYILERSEDLQYEVIPKSHIFASGLDDFYKEHKSIWFGRPRMNKGDLSKNERERLEKEFHKNNCYPVYTSKKEHSKFDISHGICRNCLKKMVRCIKRRKAM